MRNATGERIVNQLNREGTRNARTVENGARSAADGILRP